MKSLNEGAKRGDFLNSMRIVHVITDTNIGGAGRYLLNLLTQPCFKEHEVFLACPDGELAKRVDALGIKRIPISGKDVSFSFPLIFELGRVFKRIRPDVVHTHSSLAGRIAAKALFIPVVYTKHNLMRIPNASGAIPPKPGLGKRVLNRLVFRLLSDKVIGVSQGVYEELIEAGYPKDKVVAIPNGIDLSQFSKKERNHGSVGSPEPQEGSGLIQKGHDQKGRNSQKTVLIGTVARLHPQKALNVLIEAARMVVNSYPYARFVIGGTGPSEDMLRSKIADLKLEPYVKMAGFVEDVPGFLAKLHVYALSSDYEGLPLAVLEAMAAGLPCVATSVGGVPEAVVDGQTGFLVQKGNARLMAQAIARLVVDPDMARKMGEAGKRRVEEFFDARIMAEKTLSVYREISRR